MKQEVEAAFAEMLDISTDIDKAVVFGPEGVLASNMSEPALSVAVAQAEELVRLGQASAARWVRSRSLSWWSRRRRVWCSWSASSAPTA